jgi:hypothetical protein
MGFLNRLFGTSSPKPEAASAVDGFTRGPTGHIVATLHTGDETLYVVGESYRQDALWAIVGGRSTGPVRKEIVAVLIPEPDNPHDGNAIKVLIDSQHVGYLSRGDAAVYLTGLLALMNESENGLVALEGVIVGGGPRPDGIGRLGVFLDHDPADFGMAVKTLVCAICGSSFERVRTQGRKPHTCPACRGV